MTAFTITTPVNIDSLASKAGADTYAINGGYLTVDQHTRYGTNQNTSAIMGSITISATLGGTIEFNATKVRLIQYTGGSGTVPAYDTIISGSGASGKLLGVYANLTSAPTAVAAAMPATGYILIRQWNEVSFTAGALTGITATSSGPDYVGWLDIIGQESITITTARLGTFKVYGAWYDFLGTTTSGSSATGYQIPNNGGSMYPGGVEVQKSTNTITGATWALGVATYTSTAHNIVAGSQVTVTGISPSGYNVVDALVTSVTANTFSIAMVSDPGTYSSGGSAYDYEFYPNAGNTTATAATVGTDPIRGRWCWINASGLVTFANDGTNSSGGYLPPAGRKIRIPNLFFQAATSAAKTVTSVPHATLATRPEFLSTGGGVVELNTVSISWYLNFSQPFSLAFNNTFTLDNLTASEIASPIEWNNVGVGQSAILSNYGILMSLNFAGGIMRKCTWTRSIMSASGNYIKSWSDMSGFTVVGERAHSLVASRGNASTGVATMTRVNSTTFSKCLGGGGKSVLVTCSDIVDDERTYYDHPALNTIATNPAYLWELSSNCTRVTLNNPNFGGLNLVQPYNGILSIGAAGCSTIKLRNCGTYDNPLDLGAPRRDLVSWTRVTTVATATSVGHGLVTGDTIYVPVSSVTAAISVAAKTITGTPTADTFTFACTNSGATSGTLSYFPTKCANLIVFASSAAANDIKIQRCYVPHTRTNLFTGDNSSKNIVFENIISDFLNPFLTPMLNTKFKGVSGTPPLTAQAACYGTHWMDVYNADVSLNLVNQSWSRSSTTCTVTSNDHKLRTGLFISVNASSDTAAVPLGSKTVTVIDANTYTFTCLNAGATSGLLTYRTVIDKLILMMNEATAESAGHYSDLTGTAGFTSSGTLSMPAVNDSITFKMTYYRLGFTGFPIQELVMVGGTLANYNVFYKLDINDGNGDSAWHNAYYTRTGGSGTNGQYTIDVTDATGVEIGDYVWGTNVGGNAKVTNIVGNTLTLDNPNIGTVSGTIRFNHMRTDGPTLTSDGIKLTVKVVTITANSSGISSLSIFGDTDDASRSLLYPLDINTITFTGFPTGTDIVVLQAGTTTILDQVDQVSGTFWSFTYSGEQNVDVGFIKPGYVPYYFRSLSLTTEDSILPVTLTPDRNYA